MLPNTTKHRIQRLLQSLKFTSAFVLVFAILMCIGFVAVAGEDGRFLRKLTLLSTRLQRLCHDQRGIKLHTHKRDRRQGLDRVPRRVRRARPRAERLVGWYAGTPCNARCSTAPQHSPTSTKAASMPCFLPSAFSRSLASSTSCSTRFAVLLPYCTSHFSTSLHHVSFLAHA